MFLQPVKKYLDQAKKLDKVEPVVAYYCMFAIVCHLRYENDKINMQLQHRSFARDEVGHEAG